MTEAEKWKALELTDLTEHDPFCNYGRTNGREMCTCQVLVDIVEGVEPDEQPTFITDAQADSINQAIEQTPRGTRVADRVDPGAGHPRGTSSEQRARRLAERRASAAKAASKPRAH